MGGVFIGVYIVSRTLSADALDRLYATNSASMMCALVQIAHPSFSSTLYLNNSGIDLTYGGQVYTYFPFQFDPPDESESGFTNSTMSFDAVDQSIATAILAANTPPTVTVVAVVIKADEGNSIEQIALYPFSLKEANGDVNTVKGELVFDTFMDNEMGPISASPSVCPGLY